MMVLRWFVVLKVLLRLCSVSIWVVVQKSGSRLRSVLERCRARLGTQKRDPSLENCLYGSVRAGLCRVLYGLSGVGARLYITGGQEGGV